MLFKCFRKVIAINAFRKRIIVDDVMPGKYGTVSLSCFGVMDKPTQAGRMTSEQCSIFTVPVHVALTKSNSFFFLLLLLFVSKLPHVLVKANPVEKL